MAKQSRQQWYQRSGVKPLLGLAVVAVFSVFGAIYLQGSHAAVAGTHLDRSAISYNGHNYYDGKIDDNYTYTRNDDTDGCKDVINSLTSSNTVATLHTRTKSVTSGACNDKTSKIALTATERSLMPFAVIDFTHIVTSDLRSAYTYNATLKMYVEVGGDQCKDTLKVVSSTPSSVTVQVVASTAGGNTAYDSWANELKFDKSRAVVSGGCTKYTNAAANTYQVSKAFL